MRRASAAAVAGVLLAGARAFAQAGGGASEEEIARALAADEAARTKTNANAGAGAAAAAATSATPAPRGTQTLNPDISALVDFAAGGYSNANVVKSGDDPQSTGFKVQEIELALQSVVDPYFRADIFLTIPDLAGLEVEEAFLTTTSLPANLQLRAGIMRATLGRQNGQHLHLQDFTRRPLLNAALLGSDGLRSPGAEVSWLAPGIPFYLLLTGAAYSVAAADADLPLQTFGGGGRSALSYVGSARAFFPLGEATSLYLGLNYARGRTSQIASGQMPGPTAGDGLADNLYGADLYVKWKPPNQAETYASLAWQSEYFVRQIPGYTRAGAAAPQVEGAAYTQLVMQTHRRWYVGVRGEIAGLPAGDSITRQYAGAASLTWGLSEFARVRLYGEVRRGALPLDATQRTTGAAFLQLEAAIGAHGAHPF
ncbi:MAG TPA: hypothetical protein VMU50_00200 [Polyangia bacterium]|nr:hypothetical protein [Polyangia bacterium]